MLKYIEIGGGLHHDRSAEWANLDPFFGEDPWRRYAEHEGWPAADDSIEVVYASHVLEHIPAGKPRINVFNEAYRVLIPGGLFSIRVPRFPLPESVSDPTHVSFFVEDSFVYFTNPPESGLFFHTWEMFAILSQGIEIICQLRKPRSER